MIFSETDLDLYAPKNDLFEQTVQTITFYVSNDCEINMQAALITLDHLAWV